MTPLYSMMLGRGLCRSCFRAGPGSLSRGSQALVRRGLSTADEGSVEVVPDYKQFLEKLANAPKAVVYYTASWCPPCRAIKPVYASLSTKHPAVKFLKVDVDQNEEAAARASIRSVPAFHFYQNGNVVSKFAGADQKMLTSSIEELQDRS